MDDLEASGVVRVGERFDREMMTRLPERIDRFSGCGEFHTLVKVWTSRSIQ